MSKETKFKYFLNGKEVTKEAIDWNRSLSIKPVRNTNEVHVTYMSYEAKPVAKTTSECGMSTRHKACNTGYKKSFPETYIIDLKDVKILPQFDEERDINKKFQEAFGFVREVPSAEEVTIPIGVKHNKHKAPLDIVQTRQFPKALQLLALATAYGNKKYEVTDKDFLNFKRVAGGSQTYFDAAARHSTDRFGEDIESGLPHIIHAVWDNMAALEIWAEENKIDLEDFSKKYLENLHRSK